MDCVEAKTTGERREVKMAEPSNTSTTISRRSTRLFIGEQDSVKVGNAVQPERESRHTSEEKELDRLHKARKPQQKKVAPTSSIGSPIIIPLVDFGKDLGIFPSTLEDIDDQGTLSLPRNIML